MVGGIHENMRIRRLDSFHTRHAMRGRDFLPLAKSLAGGTTEAEWRTAASRAYYAVFHAGRELLATLRFGVPHADRAHEYVYRRLNNCGNAGVENAAKIIHQLRRSRNEADYDFPRPFTAGA